MSVAQAPPITLTTASSILSRLRPVSPPSPSPVVLSPLPLRAQPLYSCHFLLTQPSASAVFWLWSKLEDGGRPGKPLFGSAINFLSLEESDGVNSQITEQKSAPLRPGSFKSPGCSLKHSERRYKALHLRPSRGNATGLNMLGASKKLGENAQNIALSPGNVVQRRIFHHANITRTVVKTAAQSLEKRERKEYPPHVQKVEAEPNNVSERLEVMHTPRRDSDVDPEPLIRRKSMEQNERFEYCVFCVKENKSKTKCQSCGDAQRLCRQNTSLSESPATLARPSIHQISAVEKSLSKGLDVKNFYSSSYDKIPMDTTLKHESPRWKQYPANGKLGLSTEANLCKKTKNVRIRSTRSSEPNDTIILSSDEEDNASTGSTSRIESISPRPADSACSSPVPSSGKVEAALRENSLIDNIFSSPPEAEPVVTIPRKARMKDQFGNTVTNTPVKRRKVAQVEVPSEAMSSFSTTACESIILSCRNIRVGTLYRTIVEPVVFCVDFIKIKVQASDDDIEDVTLKTSELTTCEWCCARKLTVAFFQSMPSLCQSLRTQFKMSRQNGIGWYDCNTTNLEEQFIVLIFERPLTVHENALFEKLLTVTGVKHSIPDFFSKIAFEEANRRLVAFTKHTEETPAHISSPLDHIARSVPTETRMKLRNAAAQLQFFTDDGVGDTHNVFVGPIEKLIVYPPPPAKGGISVTNEDLHCLNEGEFLNDVIIDFYLKYLVLEKLGKKADKIHIFSSFFYKRLNQRERRNLQDSANLTLQKRRHGRVKTWTRHVDIFQKDFIFVPLNEAAHWFLAVICFPGLEEPVYYPNPYYQVTGSPAATVMQGDDSGASFPPGDSQTLLQGISSKSTHKKTPNKKQTVPTSDTSSGADKSDTPGNKPSHCVVRSGLRRCDQEFQEADMSLKSPFPQTDCSPKNVNGIASECKTPLKHVDGLHRLRISYSDSPDDLKKNEEEFIDFSDDQDNLDESSDDGGLADDNFTSEAGKWHLKSSHCKQPCILLMDSLRGPSRSTVVKTLREYLEVEWEVRKGSKRSFSKTVMKGSNPRVPQQNNFSDCGVFILQYVESFFENPIESFDLPMNLMDWFPQERMKTKREEIRNLILTLQELQSKDKKGQRDLSTTQPTPQEGTEHFVSDFETV
ncbi:sentrin-specific protease 6 isoform X3 [Mixophyes fleayi]|uniref:sentrin-specific protease 6 isoform X3 n=1 Tax=Mixophyes fleayi TaxID=3061075 RepID=UPI003F4E21BA